MNGYLTPTIAAVFQFHEKIHRTIYNQLQQEKVAASPQPGAVFFGMTSEEVDDFFRRLDQLAMFDLLSTTEAHVRTDFQDRVQKKRKDALSREFRKAAKQRRGKVRLDEDILDSWKKHHPKNKACIREFKAALKLRHWLAHGRHWVPKLGRSYTKWVVRDICDTLAEAILPRP